MHNILAILLSIATTLAAVSPGLVGGLRINTDTTNTNTTSAKVTVTASTNLNAGTVQATNSVNVGRAGEAGVVQWTSTNGTYTATISLLADGTLVVTNNGVLVASIALVSGYDGTTNLFLNSAGTYTAITSPAGVIVTNININPTNDYYPVRSNATTFKDGAFYAVNTTNVATDALLVWGPGTTNVLYRSGTDLIYTNGNTTTYLNVIRGSGQTAKFGVGSSGSADVQADSGRTANLTVSGSGSAQWSGTTFIPSASVSYSLGNIDSSAEKWLRVVGSEHYVHGVDDGAGNKERNKLYYTGGTNGFIYNVEAGGTGTYRNHTFQVGGTNLVQVSGDSMAATNAPLTLNINGTNFRVHVGAADSGGTGLRALTILN